MSFNNWYRDSNIKSHSEEINIDLGIKAERDIKKLLTNLKVSQTTFDNFSNGNANERIINDNGVAYSFFSSDMGELVNGFVDPSKRTIKKIGELKDGIQGMYKRATRDRRKSGLETSLKTFVMNFETVNKRNNYGRLYQVFEYTSTIKEFVNNKGENIRVELLRDPNKVDVVINYYVNDVLVKIVEFIQDKKIFTKFDETGTRLREKLEYTYIKDTNRHSKVDGKYNMSLSRSYKKSGEMVEFKFGKNTLQGKLTFKGNGGQSSRMGNFIACTDGSITEKVIDNNGNTDHISMNKLAEVKEVYVYDINGLTFIIKLKIDNNIGIIYDIGDISPELRERINKTMDEYFPKPNKIEEIIINAKDLLYQTDDYFLVDNSSLVRQYIKNYMGKKLFTLTAKPGCPLEISPGEGFVVTPVMETLIEKITKDYFPDLNNN